MSLTVCRQPDGSYAVLAGGEIVSPGHSSNSAAWRAVDRLEGDAVSPVEKRSDYAFRRSLQQNIPVPKKKRRRPGDQHRPDWGSDELHQAILAESRTAQQPRWLERARRVEQRPDYRLGKFGPASAVRKISVDDYLREVGKPR